VGVHPTHAKDFFCEARDEANTAGEAKKAAGSEGEGVASGDASSRAADEPPQTQPHSVENHVAALEALVRMSFVLVCLIDEAGMALSLEREL
jgi:hypothetical protein